ncbi:hypothetical protein QBC34DRAFT_412097 [Podospora aff. communis PSN243]|uniref:NACHT domain-containing protein n=1 Tax=Podospora aff. communis PSN243 TaxID=3040156 RepID=A0AAV9GBJ1_9PEZI|nr:hypothetical protein QBC34DRAFT_412097 [Podospora aff. communis PSN243]
MEPLSALGVATSVVQFVDFSSKLISGTFEIYKSAGGELGRNSAIETLTKQLVGLSERLEASLAESSSSSSSNSNSNTLASRSPNEQDLHQLCRECNGAASELLGALARLRGQPQNVWSSFRHALRTLWTEDQIDSLQRRVDRFREQISMFILASVRERMVDLDTRQAHDMDRVSQALRAFQQRNEELFRGLDRSMKWQAEVVDTIYRGYLQGPHPEGPLAHLCQHVNTVDIKIFARRLLEDLSFWELEDRHERIPAAHEKTFRWILQPSAPNQPRQGVDFIDWLEGDEEMFWITGKAGSGKSTLMKYICGESQTQQALLRWAAGRPLITAAFYFWNSGTAIQMSQEGMLRTLLHDILRQRPDLVPRVFPHRLETFVIVPARSMNPRPWKWTEISKAFQLLVTELVKTTKLCLFIDGLDEFEGDPKELIGLIQRVQQPSVKICVASRPWIVFEDAFKQKPKLTLEDLTRKDIQAYVAAELHMTPGFDALATLEPEFARTLIQNIADKSSGVFLWVFLVVRSLRDGLRDGDRIADLQARLSSLPSDLEALFWGVIRQLDDTHFQRGLQFFQLTRETIVPLTVLEFPLADEGSLDAVLAMGAVPLSQPQKAAKAEMMRRRLNACTKGLLEAVPGTALLSQRISSIGVARPTPRLPLTDSLVTYLHRTVRDFMQRHDTNLQLRAQSKPTFNVDLQLCLSYVAQLKLLDIRLCSEGRFWEIVTYAIEYATRADALGTATLHRLLDDIDRSACLQARQPGARFRIKVVDKADYVTLNEGQRASRACHWSATLPDFRKCTSFLQFAIRCQLISYVREDITRDPSLCTEQDLLPLLYYAVDDTHVLPAARDRPACSHTAPSVELVRVLLQHGADPDVFIPGEEKTIRQITEEHARRHPGVEWDDILLLYGPKKPATMTKSATMAKSRVKGKAASFLKRLGDLRTK